ncbi:response regulator [Paenibacillus woosongensis]|uniref:Circadian input-output histidine kinase CikA n=1 Tax=Paenibacillus woosongensis TaxID=307580 RepID=A0A7X2Z4D3_9BACL|nr:response regulator [Paenibacillus woosongensis]MUG46616.1 response regulator [Paenibacillus woosongensis]
MKIRSKLIIGFSSLLIIMLVLTFASYERLHFMNTQLDHVYQDGYMKVKASTGMRGDVNDMARILTNMVQVKNQDYFVQESGKLEKRAESAQQNMQLLRNSMTSGDERQLIKKIEEASLDFTNYQARIIALLSNEQYDRANEYRISSGQDIQDRLLDTLNDLKDYLDIQIEAEIKEANDAYESSIQITVATMAFGLLLGLGIVLWVLPSITKGLNVVNAMIKHFGKEQFEEIRNISFESRDEIGSVARVFQELSEDLREKQELERRFVQQQKDLNWINSNLARITELLHGINSLEQISQMFINEFTPVLGGTVGAIYIRKESENPDELYLAGSYAKEGELNSPAMFKVGEGLIGQVALDQKPISLSETPANYLSVRSALGEAKPAHVLIYPIMFEDELLGVVELACLDQFTSLEEQLLGELTVNLGVVLNNVNRRLRVEELLRESQALTEELQVQSEELQTQQEELRRSNESMEKQTAALKRSEELLQRQQEELEHYNTELIAKTRALEEQVQEVKEKNEEIEKTKEELERHASQLAVTSKYKSEFLANMSHELRTPLNSLLILSQLLSENKDNNLTPKQVEYAQTIHMSGTDLLKMIDEILDLSKVDAGKMEVNQESVSMEELERFVEHNFRPVAESKGIQLRLEVSPEVPERIMTDGHRVKQILRNLLSNAFKFTNEGEVAFLVNMASPEQLPSYLEDNREYLALTVRDTGIGVPEDKTDLIFEAFQQVDGTTSRKYGGTGLGLSISRGLSALLGGGIGLVTKEGEGSSFTLYLPKEPGSKLFGASKEAAAAAVIGSSRLSQEAFALPAPAEEQAAAPHPIEDDRELIASEDKVLLIIEDDVVFAKILLEMSRNHGFKGLVAVQGDEGLRLVHKYLPDAIILDIQLPVMDGWSILNELKSDAKTRHIPVHVISVVDDVKQGLMMGAIAYLRKPSSREHLERAFTYIESYTEKSLKHLLIVEDDEIQQKSIIELIGHDDVAITAVATGADALEELRTKHYDCMVLDLMLTDMTGFELLDQIRDDENLNDLPIIIYTGKDLDKKEETRLRKYAESIIIKDVKSPERLLDETTLFLHRVEANLPEDKRKILQKLHNKEELFEGKKILLVDDDVRNVFALSSVLEGYRMNVVYAENGREALDILEEQSDFDLILMDMMMPEMDGYEAMRRIREKPEFAKLPIIALTAKAMKEDRSKCIEAGASDYVKKPIQTDQLLSLMRVWLYS